MLYHGTLHCTVGQNSQEYRLKYWATRSSVRSFARTAHSLSLLRPARFARALRCAHSFARSLTSLTPSLVGQWIIGWLFNLCFFHFWPIVHCCNSNTLTTPSVVLQSSRIPGYDKSFFHHVRYYVQPYALYLFNFSQLFISVSVIQI